MAPPDGEKRTSKLLLLKNFLSRTDSVRGFIKLFVALFPRYGYLQLLAILRMREYSHTNVCYRYSNSGTGTSTLATAYVLIVK